MSNLKRCDKCGSVIERNKFDTAPDIHLQVRDITGEYGRLEKDLCDDCMTVFGKFIVEFFGVGSATKIDE